VTILAQQITETLRASDHPLSIAEIISALSEQGIECDRRSVNGALVSPELKGIVSQDGHYRWAIAATRVVPGTGNASRKPKAAAGRHSGTWQRFNRFLDYYLDCIQEEKGFDARAFLSDEGQRYVPFPLSSEWSMSEQALVQIPLNGWYTAFGNTLRQLGASGLLLYGYPLYIDWRDRSSSKGSFGFAIPVFLQQVEFECDAAQVTARLVMDWPRLNDEFVATMHMSREEQKQLLESLGMDDPQADLPEEGLSDIVRRATQQGMWADAIEALDPEHLASSLQLSNITTGGLYNRAVLVTGESPKYTAGLERELPFLRDTVSEQQLERSALHLFFGEAEDTAVKSNVSRPADIVEVVPLNEEQRAAVRSAFTQPLTVVTGPPGTGKSQVVLSVLANAYLNGKNALFVSKNNKAVEVVEQRINRLSDHPLMIRVGKRSGERDLRAELLQFLGQALSSSVTEDDRATETRARQTVRQLMTDREALWQKLEQVRNLRNAVDKDDARLQELRASVPEAVWQVLQHRTEVPTTWNVEQELARTKAQLEQQGGLVGRLSLLFSRRADTALLKLAAVRLQPDEDVLGLAPQDVTKQNLEDWQSYLTQVQLRTELLYVLLQYRNEYQRLCAGPTADVFAARLARIEEQLWTGGARLIAARGHLLPDRLGSDERRAVGEYRSTLERLSSDQLGGRAYADLMKEQELLFSRVTRVLPLWCVTNLSASGSVPLESAIFDILIVDEASQCDIPSVLPLLYRVKNVMIIGDPNQLRHISTIELRRDQQLQVKHDIMHTADQPYAYNINSLFDLAATVSGTGHVVALRDHFRSHADIVAFSNRQWYEGTLRVCTDYRRLKQVPGETPGIRWTDVHGTVRKPGGGGAVNVEEARAVAEQVKSLVIDRHFEGTVGVVTPFQAQAGRIRDLLNESVDADVQARTELVVNTAHGFQGDERDVIFFSPCVGPDMPSGAQYFLGATGNLFNVAITRARTLLHVVGDREACSACGIKHIAGFANFVTQLEEQKGDRAWPWDPQDPRVGYWERPFYDTLVAAGLKPMPQYKASQYVLDLAIKRDDLMLDVEVDGELYHKEWDGGCSRHDVIRDLRLAALGWTVKRFWAYQLRDDMQQCVDDVLRLVQENVQEQNRDQDSKGQTAGMK